MPLAFIVGAILLSFSSRGSSNRECDSFAGAWHDGAQTLSITMDATGDGAVLEGGYDWSPASAIVDGLELRLPSMGLSALLVKNELMWDNQAVWTRTVPCEGSAAARLNDKQVERDESIQLDGMRSFSGHGDTRQGARTDHAGLFEVSAEGAAEDGILSVATARASHTGEEPAEEPAVRVRILSPVHGSLVRSEKVFILLHLANFAHVNGSLAIYVNGIVVHVSIGP
jgi:hypothetical protein